MGECESGGAGGVCLNPGDVGIFKPALSAPPLLPRADFIANFNQVLIPLIFYVLFTGHIKKRHCFFEWLITIMASAFMCLGTQQRVWHMHGDEWGGVISRSSLKFYFTQSLVSWVACVVLDGRHTVNMCWAHGRTLIQIMVGVVKGHTPLTVLAVLEVLGLGVCCGSMLKLALDVYWSFQSLTHSWSLHFWFTACVVFKLSRMLVQGLVVLTIPDHLWKRKHRSLTQQLIVSSIFLTVQVCFLAQFTPSDWASLFLLGGDIAYRTSQFVKIAYHYWCGNRGRCHGDDRRLEQETNEDHLCMVLLFCNKIKYILEFPPRRDFFLPCPEEEEEEEGGPRDEDIQQETMAPGVWPREGVGGEEEEEEEEEESGSWVLPFLDCN